MVDEDKLFCIKCNYRIWRHVDDRPLVDLYLQNRHYNCHRALYRTKDSYAEKRRELETTKGETK